MKPLNKIHILFFSIAISLLTSCVPSHQLEIFNESEIPEIKQETLNKLEKRRIKPFDKLHIQVISIDEQTSKVFNVGASNYMQESVINLHSYQVNESGKIDFPFIGAINIAGKTLSEAKETLMVELNQYVSNTELIINFVNNKISVIGEVRIPGTMFFYDEKVTILEAISRAGGISDFGRIDNITYIQNQGDSVFYRSIDLSSIEIVNQPEYFLSPGDILIVHPIKTKYRRQRDYSFISTILSTITTSVTVITLILTNN